MFYSNLKIFLKRFPILWTLLTGFKNRLIILSRLKDVFIMMTLFQLWPEQAHRFSTRRLLPCKKSKFSQDSAPILPYELLKSKSSNIPILKEINLIARGSSFDLQNLKQLNGPIFLCYFWHALRLDDNDTIIYPTKHYPSDVKGTGYVLFGEELSDQQKKNSKELKNKNLTYIHNYKSTVEMIKKSGHNVLVVQTYRIDKEGNYFLLGEKCKAPSTISLLEKIPYPEWMPAGSVLPALCALSYLAEKINVYGWDFYLESSPEKMNYWQLFFNMYKYKYDAAKARSSSHFESALINFYYGYQLSKLPNINIHGYMGQLGKHEKMMKRIERVLFNPA